MSLVPSQLSFAEIEKSAPSGATSAIKRWYQSVQGAGGAMQRAKIHAAAAGQRRHRREPAHHHGIAHGYPPDEYQQCPACIIWIGGDYDIQGDGKMNLPVDAAFGALAMAAGVALAHEEYGKDLSNAGSAALAIFAYRKTEDYLSKKEGFAQKNPKFHGEYEFGNEDPVISAGRLL